MTDITLPSATIAIAFFTESTLTAPITLSESVCHLSFATSGSLNVPLTLPSCNISLSFQNTAFVDNSDRSFIVDKALKEVFSLWGSGCDDCVAGGDSKKVNAAFNILNGCLQEIYVKAKSLQFLSNETISVSDIQNANELNAKYFVLPTNVQAVVGPVIGSCYNDLSELLVRIQLNGLREKSQLRNFSLYHQTNGQPKVSAYFVDSGAQTSSIGERTEIRVYIPNVTFPASQYGETTSIGELSIDVEREIPRFTLSDCSKGTPIPMPHQYCESLLLPLMREKAAASPFAARRDNYPMYQAEAAAARAMFEMTDPQNPLLDGTGAKN